MADENAQTNIVAFGTLRFLDRAVADLDDLRRRTHRYGIGLVSAGAPRGVDEASGKTQKSGLIEKGIHCG